MIRSLLKKHGYENDNCMVNLLSYMHGHRGEWVNKAALTLLQFPYYEKGIKKFFAAETIGRKARKLAELNLLERKEEAHQTLYKWPDFQVLPEPPKPPVPIQYEGHVFRLSGAQLEDMLARGGVLLND